MQAVAECVAKLCLRYNSVNSIRVVADVHADAEAEKEMRPSCIGSLHAPLACADAQVIPG